MRKRRRILTKLIMETIAMGKWIMNGSVRRKNGWRKETLSKRLCEAMKKKRGKAAFLKMEIKLN